MALASKRSFLDFARRSDWVDVEGYNNDLNVRGITRYYPESTHIWIHPSFIEARSGALEGEGLGLLAHKLLHAIGFKEYIPGGAPTIMWASAPPNSPLNWVWHGLLHPVDRAALEFLADYDSIELTEENLEIWFSEKGC